VAFDARAAIAPCCGPCSTGRGFCLGDASTLPAVASSPAPASMATPSYAATPYGSPPIFYPAQLTADDVSLIVNQQVRDAVSQANANAYSNALATLQPSRPSPRSSFNWNQATFFATVALLLVELGGRR
jgi:hypothetical protein